MKYLLAEKVFKSSLMCPDDSVSESLWLSFFNGTLIPAVVYTNGIGEGISLSLSPDEFLSLVINFMDTEEIDKVCEFFRLNLFNYLIEQELEPLDARIKACNFIGVYESIED
jgi:hypothetical protein